MEKLSEIFLNNVRTEAKRRGMSYADVADKAGLSRSGVYKIMQGVREPGFDNIERMARALDVNPASLFVSSKTPCLTERGIEAIKTLAKLIDSSKP